MKQRISQKQAIWVGNICKAKIRTIKGKVTETAEPGVEQKGKGQKNRNTKPTKLADVSSNKKLAKITGVNERTVRNVLGGCCRVYETVNKVCMKLGIDLDEELKNANIEDYEYLGGYSQESHKHFIGSYSTIRPTYNDRSKLVCYQTIVEWDSNIGGLRFREKDRCHPQSGRIYIQHASSLICLLTIRNGWVRKTILTVPILDKNIFSGFVISQFMQKQNYFIPVIAPIVYVRNSSNKTVYGILREGDERNREYDKKLKFIRENMKILFDEYSKTESASILHPPGSEDIW